MKRRANLDKAGRPRLHEPGTPALHFTRNGLSASIRTKAILLLQARLTDAIDLFTQIKHAHWNVKGPAFIALHELFDEVAEVVEAQGDALAERITALGGRADGTARMVAGRSTLDDYPLDAADGRSHLAAVADRLAAFGNASRRAIDAATGAGDADTADLFTEVSSVLDKQLWLIEAHLQAEH